MEANRITAPRRGSLRTVIDRFRAFGRHAPGKPQAGVSRAAQLEQVVGAVDLLAHIDESLRFLYVSDASLRFIGYHREYLETITLHDLVAPADVPRLDALLTRATATGNVEKATLGLIKSLTYPITVELRVVRSLHDGVEGYAIAGFDVSAWRATEERLTQALHLDRLTNLANQPALIPALLDAQQQADAHGTPAALLLLDLDDYQRVNRALGYDAGDEMLRDTARRLLNMTSPNETVARVASDEFAILVKPAASRTDAAAAAEALARRLLTAIQQPYVFNGQQVHLSASIGIALYPDVRHANDDAAHDTHLLRWADHALLQAKAAGGNTLAFYVPDDNPADAERLKLEADLYDGVRNGEFSLHFQPITSSRTHGVVGVEALIRWSHPVHGLVPPSMFIPLAESIGLINFLGNWVLKVACMQLIQWDARGISLQYVAVNVSPQQFRDPRFKDSVREAIELTGIDPRRLVFEITESLLMHDPAHAKGLLEELTAMGIRFAVDDFGTGYSSLAYLQRFPLAKLKIDRSFVENLLTSRNDQAIVSAVVGLAQTLDLELVAEGVETEAQRSLLTEMGCDHIQGWLVCKALPSDELAQRFEARTLHLHTA
ncbi:MULTISPECIES: putative bifunctional diguanylate cyclase/phosphodiesterase [Paraburkholderia]|uniref:Diguanylate cyclase (GGDEF) domain-containing protein n=2 Tax=Paraburkholderia TaxID=1822464 RepID=A0A1I6XJS2_9BURK|nr:MULTISPECIES: sensor domain-containing phosphodiesterase [Paraburkholderia]KPD14831.1 diguanylate cyclase [Burkholderia sp. ST111]MBK5146611.1 sensor domain-containing phosphodiesterase [Burkholderia sp. R-69608]MCP2087561.1 diguanylate cyclase (GGDEF)-like protein [Paraburkholderia sediminicola]MBK3738027.1 sensor domain-containing phosphodiesterase [Paraburkholderia aspalathi]MBK3787152.1 sensor domain-containing phosphodiesterase [Paraburkholderia aspalathi]